MKYLSKIRKLKKKKSLKIKHRGGMPELPRTNHEILQLIKLLVKNNIQNRYEQNPEVMRENTIGPHNIDNLNQFVDSIINIHHFCDAILAPVFSKGCARLNEFVKFIENGSFWKNMEKYKALLIAQYIIINQIFGDGNHRAAIYILDHYSTYSTENKQNIMSITGRIHDWDGNLKKKKFWISQKNSEFELWLPDFTKVEEMCKYIFV
jgi:hypothetical protein